MAAAGAGNRFGGAKQFSPLGDRLVLDWVVRTAARWSEGVVVVLPESRTVGKEAWTLPGPSETAAVGEEAQVLPDPQDGAVGEEARTLSGPPEGRAGRVVPVAGGVLRSDSVRCGLDVVPAEAEIVLVHDGARPLAGDGVFERVIGAVRSGADAAVPVVGLVDTIRWRSGGVADRGELLAVQTPQAFRAGALRAAHSGGADATDDATLVEAAGGTVVTVDGDSRNLKITQPHDLVTAEALLAETLAEGSGEARTGDG